MSYIFGLIQLAIGTFMTCLTINNIIDVEAVTILNMTMSLCAICTFGFAGLLFKEQKCKKSI